MSDPWFCIGLSYIILTALAVSLFCDWMMAIRPAEVWTVLIQVRRQP